MSQIAAFLGLVILLGSIFFNAFQGQQVASIGLGFILLGIYMELRKRPTAINARQPYQRDQTALPQTDPYHDVQSALQRSQQSSTQSPPNKQ
jgi:hypothetical protein